MVTTSLQAEGSIDTRDSGRAALQDEEVGALLGERGSRSMSPAGGRRMRRCKGPMAPIKFMQVRRVPYRTLKARRLSSW